MPASPGYYQSAFASAFRQFKEGLKMKLLNYMTAGVSVFVCTLYAAPVIAAGIVNVIYAIS
jgi:hypothetical protein